MSVFGDPSPPAFARSPSLLFQRHQDTDAGLVDHLSSHCPLAPSTTLPIARSSCSTVLPSHSLTQRITPLSNQFVKTDVVHDYRSQTSSDSSVLIPGSLPEHETQRTTTWSQCYRDLPHVPIPKEDPPPVMNPQTTLTHQVVWMFRLQQEQLNQLQKEVLATHELLRTVEEGQILSLKEKGCEEGEWIDQVGRVVESKLNALTQEWAAREERLQLSFNKKVLTSNQACQVQIAAVEMVMKETETENVEQPSKDPVTVSEVIRQHVAIQTDQQEQNELTLETGQHGLKCVKPPKRSSVKTKTSAKTKSMKEVSSSLLVNKKTTKVGKTSTSSKAKDVVLAASSRAKNQRRVLDVGPIQWNELYMEENDATCANAMLIQRLMHHHQASRE